MRSDPLVEEGQQRNKYAFQRANRAIKRKTVLVPPFTILLSLMVSGKQIWWTLALWLVLTKDTNFYSPALMYFRNLPGSYHLKTRREGL